MRLKFYDIEQNGDEWYQMRGGRLTGSTLGKVMANYGKAFGEPAKKLAIQIAVERITGIAESSNFTNEHMIRGHEQEPIARQLYEMETFTDVTNGGFFCDNEIGCSPDGLVGDDGVIEIKSVISSVHYKNVERNNVDPAYKWQCIGNLFFTGRDWIDFISYCSEFPEGKQLFIHRLEKSELTDEFKKLEQRIEDFEMLVREIKHNINSIGTAA